jgi:spore coat protein A
MNVMQFRVAAKGSKDDSALPQTLRPVAKIPESSAVKTRALTLVEQQDPNQKPVQMLLNNTHWSMPVTENPVLDSVEIWNLINTTDDSHPIHLHLVKFQILDRHAFDIPTYWTKGELIYPTPVMPPEPGELGWKDTVAAYPGMVTRIIVRFEGFTGRYVWHCHLLEHEDNEMMRPFDVLAK